MVAKLLRALGAPGDRISVLFLSTYDCEVRLRVNHHFCLCAFWRACRRRRPRNIIARKIMSTATITPTIMPVRLCGFPELIAPLPDEPPPVEPPPALPVETGSPLAPTEAEPEVSPWEDDDEEPPVPAFAVPPILPEEPDVPSSTLEVPPESPPTRLDVEPDVPVPPVLDVVELPEVAIVDVVPVEGSTTEPDDPEVVEFPPVEDVLELPVLGSVPEVPEDVVPLEELPLDELPVEELPLDELPLEELPLEELPLEELPLDVLPLDELPLDDPPLLLPLLLDAVEELAGAVEDDCEVGVEVDAEALVEVVGSVPPTRTVRRGLKIGMDGMGIGRFIKEGSRSWICVPSTRARASVVCRFSMRISGREKMRTRLKE